MTGARSLLLTLALVVFTGSVQAGGCLLTDSATYQVSYVVVADQAQCDAYQPSYSPTVFLPDGIEALADIGTGLPDDITVTAAKLVQAWGAGFVLTMPLQLLIMGLVPALRFLRGRT